MKKLLLLAVINCILLTVCSQLYSQYNWHVPQRLTNGYVDRNPSFNAFSDQNAYYYYSWEYFVFERYVSPYSQICVLKMGNAGPVEAVLPLTSNSSLKRNPSIAYGKNTNNYLDHNMASALALWETNQNGKWDIYGSYYTRAGGWGAVFPFDSTAGDKAAPHSYFIDSITYYVSYIKNGDVIFRKFNPLTRAVLYDTNLTVTDTAFCSNANVWGYTSTLPQTYYLVTYEKKKPDNKRAIYYRKSTSLPVWSLPDTVAYAGDNTFSSFCESSNVYISQGVVFESSRSGRYAIYAAGVPLTSGIMQQEPVFPNQGYNYSNFVSIFFPIITDYISYQSSAAVRKGNDSLKIMFEMVPYSPPYSKDSVTIGDTSKTTRITMNNGIMNNYNLYGWVVFTKDSASFTQLWARYRMIPLGDIKRLGSTVPEKFSLSQNYPNPFNPVTKIRFDIPEYGKWNNGNDIITLKIYDLLGKEIAVLVNERFTPGVYEVTFDASKYSSGVYFYQLAINNKQLAIKKMVMIK